MAQPKQQVHPNDFKDSTAWEWIAEHEGISIADLRLKHGLERPYFSWISQLEAKRKYAGKFGPLFEKQWIFPAGVPLEQSSSYATAWFKAALVSTPYSIDLCAGMGIDSYALSQREGIKQHWANELNPDLAQLLQRNLAASKVTIAPAEELFEAIEAWKQALSIAPTDLTIYIDPDRRTRGNKAHSIEHTVPNLPSLQGRWLECAHTLVSKHSPYGFLRRAETTSELCGHLCGGIPRGMQGIIVCATKELGRGCGNTYGGHFRRKSSTLIYRQPFGTSCSAYGRNTYLSHPARSSAIEKWRTRGAAWLDGREKIGRRQHVYF